MILGIDIGNTTVEFGLIESLDEIHSMKFSTDLDKTPDDWILNVDFFIKYFSVDLKSIKNILISSVVPHIETKIRVAILKYFNKSPLFIGKDLNIPIKVNYDDPSQVGVDRLLNSYASFHITKPPILCIDFGTAITFDVVSKKGEYEGGLIFPGMETSLKCLFSKTAKLPKVSLEKPDYIVGKNTVKSIQSGIYYGYLSLVEGIIKKVEESYKEKFNIILTGGNADIIAINLKRKFIFEPKLPMKGIFYLAKSLM
ncbi:type III pantothenate kinase [Sulfurihydrogenibium azorense]|uniref:type III pantothenate kinase n=1 Tax=Sulfurihydrogenibium azorense TaxID=309806 RepID=UPI00240A9AA1|nr:type III pantothenate kinase [Sulfurihydrogenibium azorense]MDM7274482.1 type III pantothenate kinase [Sulfurihydrogenibium azorense]